MMFSESEVRQLLYCAAEELRARRLGKPPGPARWLAKLIRRLELELAVSTSGQEACCKTADLNYDRMLTAREAAEILEVTSRTIRRRLAGDLEGQLIGRQWMFPESVVREYAEGLTDVRSAS
jgi:hypothetical protein